MILFGLNDVFLNFEILIDVINLAFII